MILAVKFPTNVQREHFDTSCTVLQYILLLTDRVLILAELLSSAHAVDRVLIRAAVHSFVKRWRFDIYYSTEMAI